VVGLQFLVRAPSISMNMYARANYLSLIDFATIFALNTCLVVEDDGSRRFKAVDLVRA
jgi:hypothetical protein